MPPFRLSDRSARIILDQLEAKPTFIPLLPKTWQEAWNALENELRRVIGPHGKSSQVKKTERRKRQKQLVTKELREEVEKRSAGYCEAETCNRWFTSLNPGELDHFFGRGKEPQTFRNCWFLCRECHRAKTDNKPHAAFWLQEFIAHCQKNQYQAELAHAQKRYDAIQLVKAAGEIH